MSKSKHTPGPWSYFHDTCAECEREGRAEYDIPEVPGGHHGRFTNEDDARLIAAAPELLDVAKALRQHLALFCGPDDAVAQGVFEIADAAIGKAEGQS